LISEQVFNALWGALLVVSIIVFIPLSERMNKKLLESTPQPQPYKWGFFLGLAGTLAYGGLGIIMLGYSLFAQDGEPLEGIITAILFALFVIPHVLTIKRKKWALILATISTINPIVWIASISYIKKRWGEL